MIGPRRAVTTAGLAALALVLPLATQASAVTISPPLVSGLLLPLGVTVGGNDVYVSSAALGTIDAVNGAGAVRRVTQEAEGAEITGLDIAGRGTLVYTTTTGDETNGVTAASLKTITWNGRVRTLANILRYEQEKNPDSVNNYGWQDLAADCKAALPDFVPHDAYNGVVDSHAYSVSIVPTGWVVGDAAGNDLVHVAKDGRLTTLTVLPPQPVRMTSRPGRGVRPAPVRDRQGLQRRAGADRRRDGPRRDAVREPARR